MGDTADYLTLAAQRPPVYGWMLIAYRWMTGGLLGLPLFQLLLLAAGLLLFAVELGLLMDSLLVGPVSMLLILLHPTIHDAARVVETESLFLGLLLGGLGLLFRAVRAGSGAGGIPALTGAASLFALAAATRTTGAAFLPLAPLVAALDARLSWRVGLGRAGLAVAAMALVLVVAMAGNWERNDRFEIGSFAGVSLLGKALVLIQPSDLPAIPEAARAAVAATVVPAAHARALVAGAPDPAASMRAQMQVLEDLRFAVFFPAAMANWPAFAQADWRERAVLCGGIARKLILAHPIGYAELAMRDWTELVLYPNYWPAWATAEPAPRSQFPACAVQKGCYALDRYDLPASALVSILLASVAGVVAASLLVLIAAPAVLRRRAYPRTTLFFGCALVLHASLLVSAAAEGGFVRYTVALHVLDVALLLWLVAGLVRRLPRSRSGFRARSFEVGSTSSVNRPRQNEKLDHDRVNLTRSWSSRPA